jgi:LysM repeat protein
MYGMAALPSEQIKTITPDYGRGDDAMSRMGLSTEPIRQEMMQGANKALELTRSQVGTAGQLQSRGQSIMSNVGSQLSQSQLQQQQYLNQLRGALAQREDTKANVLAQSELTAREAKSAERAAKLDQLNNAISQTSAIGAGTMEQASKMSTIENENERFKRSQMQLMEMANLSNNFKVVRDKDGNISYEFNGGNPIQSSIVTPSLVSPSTTTNNAATGNNTPSVAPASNAVVQVTPKEHVVKKGEGLNAIAAQYKIPVDKLLKLNNLKIGDTIHPNQKLKIE